jgi:hypothetical protein
MESKASVEEERKRFEAATLDRHTEMAKTNALLAIAPTTERDAKNGGSHRARAHEPPTPAATPCTNKRVARSRPYGYINIQRRTRSDQYLLL